MADCGKLLSQERSVVELFDAEAETYSDKYRGESSQAHSFLIRLQRVCEMLDGVEGSRLLDVGCGPGVAVNEMVKRGYEFYGLDISQQMIAECNRRYGHIRSARFSVGNVEGLTFPDSFFDIVLAMGVIEYLANPGRAVKEVSRVLRPGGTAIITVPNKRSPYRVWNPIYNHASSLIRRLVRPEVVIQTKSVTHTEYTETQFCGMLKPYGLSATDVVYYNFKLVMYPLDRFFPNLTVATSRRLESLCRSRLRWLGTGFIVKARKG